MEALEAHFLVPFLRVCATPSPPPSATQSEVVFHEPTPVAPAASAFPRCPRVPYSPSWALETQTVVFPNG